MSIFNPGGPYNIHKSGENNYSMNIPIPKDEAVKREIIDNIDKVLRERASLLRKIEEMSNIPLE